MLKVNPFSLVVDVRAAVAAGRRSALVGVALLLGLPLGVAAAGGAHGSLDASFGKGGMVTTAVGRYGGAADALVIQPDGKIVAAGGSPGGITLMRYLP